MAAIFLDGFDHYATGDTLLKYTSAPNNWSAMVTGLLGTGQAARLNSVGATSAPFKSLSSTVTTFVFGFRLRVSNLTTFNQIFSIWNGSGAIIACLAVTTSGALQWLRGNGTNVVATSSNGIIVSNAINYVEVKVTLATGATGTIQVRMNGADVIPSTGSTQTANTTAAMTSFSYGSASGTLTDYDDFYLFDTTGSQNNDFAGDSRIVTVMPNGNGRVNQWTRTGGTVSGNFTAVSETTPDGDTSYVSSSTVGQIDAYTLTSAGSPTAVKCVQINTDARKDDAGTRTIAHGVGNGTTENFDAGTNVGTSYGYLIRTLDTNPLTSAAWATSDLTTLQSAIKTIA